LPWSWLSFSGSGGSVVAGGLSSPLETVFFGRMPLIGCSVAGVFGQNRSVLRPVFVDFFKILIFKKNRWAATTGKHIGF
jgi:hypothetical protein